MALNDFDSKRQYTRYTRHVNNAHEHVKAEHLNRLQHDVNIQQVETNNVKDTAFEERVYTIFENNMYTNAMFIDSFRHAEYVNLDKSQNVVTDFETSRLMLKKDPDTNITYPQGVLSSVVITSPYGEEIKMNDFFFIADEYKPVGSEIKYYIRNFRKERWPLRPNTLKTPQHLSIPIQYGFSVVIEMYANALGESPILNGYAILYWDSGVEEALGMTNPDLARFPKG